MSDPPNVALIICDPIDSAEAAFEESTNERYRDLVSRHGGSAADERHRHCRDESQPHSAGYQPALIGSQA